MMPENVIYVEKSNFLFAYVPKVACTNWKCVIRNILGHADYLDAVKAHDRATSGLVFLSDLPEKKRKQLLDSRDTRKYAFVRDPYTRALSAYLNKVEPFIKYGESYFDGNPLWFHVYKQVKQFAGRVAPSEKGVNLFVFLLWIKESGSPNAKDEHWLPQSEIIGANDVKYDYIGRFERIETDSSRMLDLLGASCAFPSQSELQFPPTGASRLLDRYVFDRERELIRTMYRRDFETLGYAY